MSDDKSLIDLYIETHIGTLMRYWPNLTMEESDFALYCYWISRKNKNHVERVQSSAVFALISAIAIMSVVAVPEPWYAAYRGAILFFLALVFLHLIAIASCLSMLRALCIGMSKEDMDSCDVRFLVDSIGTLISVRPPNVRINTLKMASYSVFLPISVFCAIFGEYFLSWYCFTSFFMYMFCISEHRAVTEITIKNAYMHVIGHRNSEWLELTSRVASL